MIDLSEKCPLTTKERIFLFPFAGLALGVVYLEWMEGSIQFIPFLLGLLLFILSAIAAARGSRLVSTAGLLFSTHTMVLSSGMGESALYAFYFIPMLFAARLWGLKGSAFTGLIVVVLYATLFIGVSKEEILAELVEETITFLFVALLSGFLVDRLRNEEDRRRKAEKEEAERKHLADLGLIAAEIAHDFRNPLQVIGGAAETLNEKDLVLPNGRGLLSDISSESRRMEALVKDVLVYGRPVINKVSGVKLSEIIDRAAALAGTGVEVESDGEIELQGDPDALVNLFSNLFSNSIEARASKIRVGLSSDGKEIAAIVSDNGLGISRAIGDTLFLPFRTTKKNGTGLGLAIARSIAEAHGGRLKILSSTKGAAFAVYLPLPGDDTVVP